MGCSSRHSITAQIAADEAAALQKRDPAETAARLGASPGLTVSCSWYPLEARHRLHLVRITQTLPCPPLPETLPVPP